MNNKISHSNLQAEKAFLGWMQYTSDFIDIPEDYLYNSKIRKIYQNWKSQYFEDGSFRWDLLPDELLLTISACMDVATTKNVDPIVTQLRKAYMVRQTIAMVIDVQNKLDGDVEGVEAALSEINTKCTKLLTDSFKEIEYSHPDSTEKYIANMSEIRESGKEFAGERSHLPDIDYVLSGWQRGKVYLLAGLEKLGKSRLVRNLFSTWLDNGYGCIMFLLEEDEEAIHECVLSCRSRVNSFLFNTNKMSQKQFDSIKFHNQRYKQQPFHISVKSSINPQYIRSIIQKKKIEFLKNGSDVVFVAIDYIQRMTNEGQNKHEETEQIASQLADIARDEDVCLIEISQMNSGAEKTKGIPLHTQLRYGKVFKEAASTIITLDDPERNEKEGFNVEDNPEYKTIRAHIIQRKGMSNVNVDLKAELQYSTFSNFARGEYDR